MTNMLNYVKLLKCPNRECIEKTPIKGHLSLVKPKYKHGLLYSGILKCQTCNEEFPIRKGIPVLIPERIRKCLEGKISIEQLNEYDREIVNGISWSEKMVPSYHENVVDQFTSAFGARYIERYEDLYIDRLLDNYIKKERRKVIFIEMGVGTGRYMLRYGARLVNNGVKLEENLLHLPMIQRIKKKACKRYREDPVLRKYYSYDKDYNDNLQLLVGVDFQEGMIKKCMDNLKHMELYSLFGKRILLIIAAGQYFNLSIDQIDEFKDSLKIATCVFQTLGNQKRELQIDLLKTLKRLVFPNGLILVSVFNVKMFEEFGIKRFYKYEVAPTVGEIRNDSEALKLRERGILVTKRGVYSQWFSEDDLEGVFKTAGLSVKIKSGDQLPTFENDVHYIDEDKQKEVKKVLIIAESRVE